MNLVLDKNQQDYLFELLDRDLKTNGLASLNKVVDLYNCFVKASVNEVIKEEPKLEEISEKENES